jgi:hypothetical protein
LADRAGWAFRDADPAPGRIAATDFARQVESRGDQDNGRQLVDLGKQQIGIAKATLDFHEANRNAVAVFAPGAGNSQLSADPVVRDPGWLP